MKDQETPKNVLSADRNSCDSDISLLAKTSSPPKTVEESVPKQENRKDEKKTILPSHATLAFSNYPPLWSPDAKRNPLPKTQRSAAQPYTSAESMRAILDTGSSSSKKSTKTLEERDLSNNHQYLQGPDRSYTHPRLNIFGTDVGPLGRPPSFRWRKKK